MPDDPTTPALRVLVLGGYGAVGRHAVAALSALGHRPVVAGRDPARAELRLDLTDLPAVAAAARDVDVVLNAAGAEDVDLVAAATAAGTAFVDISASADYLARVEEIPATAPVVLSVGIAPGLTNLLVHAVADHDRAAAPAAEAEASIGTETGARTRPRTEPLDVAVVLGAGEAHGAAATAWSLGLLGRRYPDTASTTGGTVRNYTGGATFELPAGRRLLFRADFSDQHTLTRELGRPVRTYFGTDTRFATVALAALTWAPPVGRLAGRLHLPGSEDWVLQVRDSSGPRLTATGRGQSHATGVLAAHAAVLAAQAPAGVHHLPALTELAALDLPFPLTWHQDRGNGHESATVAATGLGPGPRDRART